MCMAGQASLDTRWAVVVVWLCGALLKLWLGGRSASKNFKDLPLTAGFTKQRAFSCSNKPLIYTSNVSRCQGRTRERVRCSAKRLLRQGRWIVQRLDRRDDALTANEYDNTAFQPLEMAREEVESSDRGPKAACESAS
jgi:hypothetical protein